MDPKATFSLGTGAIGLLPTPAIQMPSAAPAKLEAPKQVPKGDMPVSIETAKNTLQHFSLVKRILFEYRSIKMPPHDMFQCTIVFGNQSIMGGKHARKVEAEKETALMVCKFLWEKGLLEVPRNLQVMSGATCARRAVAVSEEEIDKLHAKNILQHHFVTHGLGFPRYKSEGSGGVGGTGFVAEVEVPGYGVFSSNQRESKKVEAELAAAYNACQYLRVSVDDFEVPERLTLKMASASEVVL